MTKIYLIDAQNQHESQLLVLLESSFSIIWDSVFCNTLIFQLFP